MTSPPPTPNSALKKPATTPMTASRSTARIVWGVDALARLREASGPRGDPPRHRRDARADRRAAGGRRRSGRDARGAARSRRAVRARRRDHRPAGAARPRDGRRVAGVQIVGNHGLELADDADEWRGRLRVVPRQRRLAGRGQGPRALVPLPHASRPRSGARRARARRRARASGRLPRAVREDGARGAAAARRRQGHGRARAARTRGPRRARCSRATTRPISTPSARSTSWRSASRSPSTRPRRRLSFGPRADVVVPGTAGLVELLRTL